MTAELRTSDELAARWRCKEQAVRDAITRGDLRATKIAGRWLVTEADAAAYAESRMNVRPVAKRTRRPQRRGRVA